MSYIYNFIHNSFFIKYLLKNKATKFITSVFFFKNNINNINKNLFRLKNFNTLHNFFLKNYVNKQDSNKNYINDIYNENYDITFLYKFFFYSTLLKKVFF